jgi:hypothetical protein
MEGLGANDVPDHICFEKIAEINEVHRVSAPDLKWAGDTTQIKLMLEKGKKTCIDEC